MDVRDRRVGWRASSGVILLTALVAGCISVPVPTPEAKPRFSSAQLDIVGREATTSDGIRAELGPPDLTRDNGRIWIYAWHKVSGMLIDVPLSRHDRATPGGEIVSQQSLLVLEFDADGNLQGQELAQEAPHSGRRPYCTQGGVCVAGELRTWDESFGPVYVFDDQASTVTVKGRALERFTRLEPTGDECLLTVWPSAEWKRLRSFGRSGDEPPDALTLMVEGTVHWWHWQSVPMGTYARTVVPAGPRLLSVRDPQWVARSAGAAAFDESTEGPASSATFRCSAGERVYLAIDPTLRADKGFPGGPWNGPKGFPIVLRAVDEAEAQSTIASMPQVLPPN